VLVHLCGGEDLTLYEIELLMQSLSKFVPDKAHVLFGAAVDPSMGDHLSITMVSSLPEDRLYATRSVPIEKPALLEPSVGFSIDEPEEAPAPAPVIRPARAKKPAAAAVASLFEEPAPVVAEFSAPKPVAEPAPEPAMPFAEPEPSPFAIDHSLPPEITDSDDFAGQAPESTAPPAEIEEPAEPAPVLHEAEIEEEEEPAFFTIADEQDPDDEPVFAEIEAEEEKPVVLSGVFDDLEDLEDLDEPEPAPVIEKPAAPPAKPRAGGKGQPELSFEGGPRGKFEGASPSLFEGEDLDVPAFLRKKR
jgi:cell division protein FtsZ